MVDVGEALAPILHRLDARLREQRAAQIDAASEGHGLNLQVDRGRAHDKSAWVHAEASEL